MSLYIAKQDGGVASCGNMPACSGLLLATTPENCRITSSPGAPDTRIPSIGGASGVARAAFMMQTPAGEPGVPLWNAGDWTIRLHSIPGGFSGWLLQSIHICRVSVACAVVTTIGSVSGLGITLSHVVEEIDTVVVPGVSHTGDPTDTIYIVCGCSKGVFGAIPHSFLCDQFIDTPIQVGAEVPADGDAYGVFPSIGGEACPYFFDDTYGLLYMPSVSAMEALEADVAAAGARAELEAAAPSQELAGAAPLADVAETAPTSESAPAAPESAPEAPGHELEAGGVAPKAEGP